MYSNIVTPNNHLFSFGTNGKVVVLGVPILKHFRVAPGIVIHYEPAHLDLAVCRFSCIHFWHFKYELP